MFSFLNDVDWPRVRELALRGLRYGGMGMAGLGALALALLLAAFVALQFGAVRSALGDRLIASLGEGDGLTIEIDRYRGVWPVSFGADTITIRDGGELLVEIRDADLSWKPFALLSGTVHVTSLEASDITVHSFGAGDDTPSEPGPLIPRLPVSVLVDSLMLPQITLMQEVVGTAKGGAPVVLAVEGRGGLTGSGATLAVTAARTDGGRFDLDAALTYAPDAQTLAFDVSLEDGSAAAPGLIAALTGNADLAGVSLTATGDGPVDSWQGRVQAQAGRFGNVEATAQGDRRDGKPMRIALDIRPGPALEGVPATVNANTVLVRNDDRYTFTDLRVEAGDTRFDGQVAVADPLGAPRLDATGTLAGLASLLGADMREAVAADAVDVVLDVSADDTLTQFNVARLRVSASAADAAQVQQVTFAGAVDTHARTVRGQGSVVLEDVTPFAALAGVDMAGALEAELAIDRATFGGAVAGTLDAVYRPARLPDPRLLPLVGEQLSIAARVSDTDDGQTRIETLTVTPLSGIFEGTATGLVSASAADLEIALDADDLAPFSDLAGVPLTGSGAVTAALAGPFDALQADIEVSLDAVQVSGTPVSGPVSGTATATLALAPSLSGPVAFTGTAAGAPAAATLVLDTVAGATRLSDISASLLGMDVRGNVTLPSGDMPVTVQLDGTITDLAMLGRVLGTPLQGTGTFAATSAQNADGPLTIEAALRRVAVSGVSIAALNLDGTLAQTGEVAARLRARAMEVAHIDIEQVRLDVSGPVSGGELRLDVSAALSGISTLEDARGTGELAVAAVYSASTVRVSSLNGRIGTIPLDLETPFTVTLDDGVDVAPLRLATGAGELTASFSQDAASLAGTLEMRDLPLRLLAVLAGDSSAVRGTLDGSAELSTSRSTGSGRATLRLSPRVAGDDTDIPDVTLDATWDGRVAAGTVTSDAPGADDLMVTAQLPVRVRNGVPDVPPDARLEALMKGTLDVGAFWPLVPVDGHRLLGALVVDASASGPLDDLALSGTATMRDGLYENYDTGLLVSPLNVSLDATSRSGRVEVSGRDGASGTMSGRGVLDLRDSAQQRLDVSLDLSSFAIARRDEVTARASGDVAVTWPRGEDGAPTPVVVGGRITVERLEAVIPDRLASDVETIDITRVDAEGVPLNGEASNGIAGEAPRSAATDTPSAIELALTIDVPNQAFVRGRGLESEWAGKLAVNGSTDAPDVRGAFEVVRGTFDFLGQTFDLTGGRIEFTGGREIDPLLNVRAVYEDDGFQAVVAVTGPSSDPDIAISSVPALPEEEVLSRILFGTGTGQLSAFQAVQLAQTAATLTGLSGGGGGVLDAMRRTLGVDVLSVGEDGLEVGSYVSDGVYLGVAQGLEANSGQVTVEVELTDDISVESDVGAAGDTSVGVTWERDY